MASVISELRAGGTRASEMSVAGALENNQVMSTTHPHYVAETKHLMKIIEEMVQKRSVSKSSMRQAVCSMVLSEEDRAEVESVNPDFRVVWPYWRQTVHPLWSAHREMVNQHMTNAVRSYADKYVHCGGTALSYLTAGIENVVIGVDMATPVAVHETITDDNCTARLATSCLATAERGWVVPVDMMQRYLGRKCVVKKASSELAGERADAYIVDGSLYALSPEQFAAGMLECRADVGMYCIPYSSEMLVQGQGVVGRTGVRYVVTEQDVVFQYPEGVAGVTRYAARDWHSWLMNSHIVVPGCVDQGVSFQFELLGQRGPFMVVQVVRVQGRPTAGATIVHALDIAGAQDKTLVSAWRLRDMTSDPKLESSWRKVTVTVPTRVVTKVYEFALALPAEQFSRYNVRERISVVNDRVTVQGTTVKVFESLTAEAVDVLEIAVFTKAFVTRYETNKMSKQLQAAIAQHMGFSALSTAEKLSRVLYACGTALYDWTIAGIDESLRRFFDGVRTKFGGLPKDRLAVFQPVPSFLRYETVIGAGTGRLKSALTALTKGLFCYDTLSPGMPGFSVAVLGGEQVRSESESVQMFCTDTDVYEVSRNGVEVFDDLVEFGQVLDATDGVKKFANLIVGANELDEPDSSRYYVREVMHEAGLAATDVLRDDFTYNPAYVETLDEMHDAAFPGVKDQNYYFDTSSLINDDQARVLSAEYLEMPKVLGGQAPTTRVYPSRLKAYAVTKRPQVAQELLSAVSARNLSAPTLQLPQNEEKLLDDIWENFMDNCIPGARAIVDSFQHDPISVEERALLGWGSKARPDKIDTVVKGLLDGGEAAWEAFRVDKYQAMIKTDVKPPLSSKPITGRVEPQVIVHHEGAVNAVFSSIFRVLVRRLVSLLKPNMMLNLLKDMPQVRDMMQSHQPWGEDVVYLENDFSKYDKSQGRFAFAIERMVFMKLGLSTEMLEHWELGHIDCSIKSLAFGLSLSVRYQRKSGDATTAMMNGVINMLSVLYTYRGTDIVWAVFMGDDSLICARSVVGEDSAAQMMAEVFNLQAKFFVTKAPYFASNFVLVHTDQRRIVVVPDPLKRAEKWSMAIAAKDPKWDDRYQSAKVTMDVFKRRNDVVGLGSRMRERYSFAEGFNTDVIADAMASAIVSFSNFRAVWHDDPVDIVS